MKKFLDSDFMLNNETAKKLYNDYAKDMPIYDYHCHISPKEIWEDNKYETITQVWLYGDHYKWRAMRTFGIDEAYITGDKSDYEKFMAYAKLMPYCFGNPLYHWTHLELQRYFDVYEELNEETAPAIWEKANSKLQNGFTVRKMIEYSNVEMICSTDDPIDTLEYHQKIKNEGKLKAKVLPAFRPDKILSATPEYISSLSSAAGIEIKDIKSLLSAIDNRVEYFHKNGCRLSDHGFDYVPYAEASEAEVNAIFQSILSNKSITLGEKDKYVTFVMQHLATLYSKYNWTMQLHIGAMRNNNTSMFKKLGPDTGFDSINDYAIALPLSKFLNSVNDNNNLPKTILYTLNPKDNYVLGSMLGNFQDGRIAGKIQFGSGWWFNDQRDGMVEQMKALSSLGLLSKFVGMLTDSRSFLSYTRHEYFRRIMCNLIGTWVEDGEYPNNIEFLGKVVKDISYNNAAAYFDMGE